MSARVESRELRGERASGFRFQRLDVWKRSIAYADAMIDIAESLPRHLRFSFVDQLIRAALSIPNNIAEGSGRRSGAESKNFYNIAKGSTYETINILVLLVKRGLLPKAAFDIHYLEANEICAMLSGLMGFRV